MPSQRHHQSMSPSPSPAEIDKEPAEIDKEQGLTQAQKRCLDAIRSYIDQNGIPPSIRDVCQQLGYASTSSVQVHFKSLQILGAIELRQHVPRSVRVLWPRPEVDQPA